MIQRRYYIRVGAKTTAGGTVGAGNTLYKIDGMPLACEGDAVDCPACGTKGVIRCVMPRIPDRLNGKEFALSDDLCICNCSPPPKLLGEQTAKFQLLALVSEDLVRQAGPREGRPAAPPIYDEQPQLVAPPIEGMPYFIETTDGRTFSGRAGPGGLLPRVTTMGEGEYHVYWGDEALHRIQGVAA